MVFGLRTFYVYVLKSFRRLDSTPLDSIQLNACALLYLSSKNVADTHKHTQRTIFRLGILIHIYNYCLWCFGTTFGCCRYCCYSLDLRSVHTLDKTTNGTVEMKEQKRNLDLLTTGKGVKKDTHTTPNLMSTENHRCA